MKFKITMNNKIDFKTREIRTADFSNLWIDLLHWKVIVTNQTASKLICNRYGNTGEWQIVVIKRFAGMEIFETIDEARLAYPNKF